MNELLDEIMDLGHTVSARSDDRGMTSLVLQYNPYEAHWEARVDWSDRSEVKVTGPNGEVVLDELRNKMREVVEKMSRLITLHVSEKEYATILNVLNRWSLGSQTLARKLEEQKIIRDDIAELERKLAEHG